MIRLSLACGDYDRTRPLIDGTVKPLGIDLTCLPMPVETWPARPSAWRSTS